MSEIKICNKTSEDFKKYSKIIATNSYIKICNRSVGADFVKESLKKCDVLFVNVDENDDVRGFATILFDEIGIYIDTICSAAPYHPMKRRSGEFMHYSGKHIIEHIIEFASLTNIKKIHLSALENVITYYYKLNFKFYGSHSEFNEVLQKKEKELIAELRNNDDPVNFVRNLNKLLIRKFPGYLSEKKQGSISKLNSPDDEERTAFIRSGGIPMIYSLPEHIEKSPEAVVELRRSQRFIDNEKKSSKGGNKKTRKRKYKKTK